jgi:hypothetical protein
MQPAGHERFVKIRPQQLISEGLMRLTPSAKANGSSHAAVHVNTPTWAPQAAQVYKGQGSIGHVLFWIINSLCLYMLAVFLYSVFTFGTYSVFFSSL